MSEETNPNENDNSIAGMIHRIKIGTLNPRTLKKEQRLLCVDFLFFESNSSTSNIAQFLKYPDRTIRRDLEEIRAQSAVRPNPELAWQTIGEYLRAARMHHANLMRLARNSSASVSERAYAEHLAYLVFADMLVKMQSLGYLPKSADSLIVFQKKQENDADDRLMTLLTELDDMAALESDPQQKQILLDKKKIISKADSDDPKQR